MALLNASTYVGLKADGTPNALGKVYTYAAGTLTPLTTYTTAALSVANTNPVTLSAGGTAEIWLDPALSYRIIEKTAALATVRDVDNITSAISGADLASTATGKGDALIGVKHTGTGSSARTQHDRNQEDIRSTDFSTLQAAVTASVAAGVRLLIIGNYSMGTTPLTLPAHAHLVLQGGATLTWSGKPTAASGTFESGTVYAGIELQGDNVVIEGDGFIVGPSSATYVTNEAGIFRSGTSSASRGIGVTIRGGVEVRNWGAYGLLTQFVDGITLEGPFKLHSVGYAGALVSSASRVRVRGGEIGNITPGTIGNAYGFTLSHNSTGYSGSDKAATNPFCWDVVIDGLTVYDIPIWQAIDAHGAYEASVVNCKTYNCKFGIAISGGSGAAANYAGWNNHVIGNTISINKRDGTATTVATTTRTGINISGGSTSLNDGVICALNVIDGYGDTTPNGGSITAQYVRNAQIRGNTITNWAGRGIYTAYGGGICDGNIFDAVSSATNSTALYFDTTTDTWGITGNRHRPLTGTVAAEGLRFVSGNPRCLVAGNDLDSATTPYTNITGANTLGLSEITPQITVTGTPTTIDIAPAGHAPDVWVNLNVSGPSTVAAITGAYVGQRITLYASTTNATTFDRTNAALSGGANWVSTQYDTLSLMCVSTSATVKFVELSRANS